VLSDRVEQELIKDPSSELIEPSSEQSKEMVDGSGQAGSQAAWRGDRGGVESCCGGAEKLEHWRIRSLSWPIVILSSGLRAKIIPRMSFNSSDKGRMSFKKFGFLVKALYVESSADACFHGLRPQVRLTRITPRDQMSLGAHRYDGFLED
jgi:hypothetical protein